MDEAVYDARLIKRDYMIRQSVRAYERAYGRVAEHLATDMAAMKSINRLLMVHETMIKIEQQEINNG